MTARQIAIGDNTSSTGYESEFEPRAVSAEPVAFGLRGWLHPARGRRGVVIFNTLAYQALCCQPALRALAECIPPAGLPCLRFDYPSEGDSLGQPHEPRRVADWLDGAWSAQRVFLLVGEAGIGKSRLLQEFSTGRQHAICVQSRPGDAGIAYAMLARLIRSVLAATGLQTTAARTRELALILPELGSPVSVAGEAQRLLLQRTVEQTLADSMRAGVQSVIVDDLHFADEASVEFVQSMLQSDALAALRWGFAQRPARHRARQRARSGRFRCCAAGTHSCPCGMERSREAGATVRWAWQVHSWLLWFSPDLSN